MLQRDERAIDPQSRKLLVDFSNFNGRVKEILNLQESKQEKNQIAKPSLTDSNFLNLSSQSLLDSKGLSNPKPDVSQKGQNQSNLLRSSEINLKGCKMLEQTRVNEIVDSVQNATFAFRMLLNLCWELGCEENALSNVYFRLIQGFTQRQTGTNSINLEALMLNSELETTEGLVGKKPANTNFDVASYERIKQDCQSAKFGEKIPFKKTYKRWMKLDRQIREFIESINHEANEKLWKSRILTVVCQHYHYFLIRCLEQAIRENAATFPIQSVCRIIQNSIEFFQKLNHQSSSDLRTLIYGTIMAAALIFICIDALPSQTVNFKAESYVLEAKKATLDFFFFQYFTSFHNFEILFQLEKHNPVKLLSAFMNSARLELELEDNQIYIVSNLFQDEKIQKHRYYTFCKIFALTEYLTFRINVKIPQSGKDLDQINAFFKKIPQQDLRDLLKYDPTLFKQLVQQIFIASHSFSRSEDPLLLNSYQQALIDLKDLFIDFYENKKLQPDNMQLLTYILSSYTTLMENKRIQNTFTAQIQGVWEKSILRLKYVYSDSFGVDEKAFLFEIFEFVWIMEFEFVEKMQENSTEKKRTILWSNTLLSFLVADSGLFIRQVSKYQSSGQIDKLRRMNELIIFRNSNIWQNLKELFSQYLTYFKQKKSIEAFDTVLDLTLILLKNDEHTTNSIYSVSPCSAREYHTCDTLIQFQSKICSLPKTGPSDREDCILSNASELTIFDSWRSNTDHMRKSLKNSNFDFLLQLCSLINEFLRVLNQYISTELSEGRESQQGNRGVELPQLKNDPESNSLQDTREPELWTRIKPVWKNISKLLYIIQYYSNRELLVYWSIKIKQLYKLFTMSTLLLKEQIIWAYDSKLVLESFDILCTAFENLGIKPLPRCERVVLQQAACKKLLENSLLYAFDVYFMIIITFGGEKQIEQRCQHFKLLDEELQRKVGRRLLPFLNYFPKESFPKYMSLLKNAFMQNWQPLELELLISSLSLSHCCLSSETNSFRAPKESVREYFAQQEKKRAEYNIYKLFQFAVEVVQSNQEQTLHGNLILFYLLEQLAEAVQNVCKERPKTWIQILQDLLIQIFGAIKMLWQRKEFQDQFFLKIELFSFYLEKIAILDKALVNTICVNTIALSEHVPEQYALRYVASILLNFNLANLEKFDYLIDRVQSSLQKSSSSHSFLDRVLTYIQALKEVQDQNACVLTNNQPFDILLNQIQEYYQNKQSKQLLFQTKAVKVFNFDKFQRNFYHSTTGSISLSSFLRTKEEERSILISTQAKLNLFLIQKALNELLKAVIRLNLLPRRSLLRAIKNCIFLSVNSNVKESLQQGKFDSWLSETKKLLGSALKMEKVMKQEHPIIMEEILLIILEFNLQIQFNQNELNEIQKEKLDLKKFLNFIFQSKGENEDQVCSVIELSLKVASSKDKQWLIAFIWLYLFFDRKDLNSKKLSKLAQTFFEKPLGDACDQQITQKTISQEDEVFKTDLLRQIDQYDIWELYFTEPTLKYKGKIVNKLLKVNPESYICLMNRLLSSLEKQTKKFRKVVLVNHFLLTQQLKDAVNLTTENSQELSKFVTRQIQYYHEKGLFKYSLSEKKQCPDLTLLVLEIILQQLITQPKTWIGIFQNHIEVFNVVKSQKESIDSTTKKLYQEVFRDLEKDFVQREQQGNNIIDLLKNRSLDRKYEQQIMDMVREILKIQWEWQTISTQASEHSQSSQPQTASTSNSFIAKATGETPSIWSQQELPTCSDNQKHKETGEILSRNFQPLTASTSNSFIAKATGEIFSRWSQQKLPTCSDDQKAQKFNSLELKLRTELCKKLECLRPKYEYLKKKWKLLYSKNQRVEEFPIEYASIIQAVIRVKPSLRMESQIMLKSNSLLFPDQKVLDLNGKVCIHLCSYFHQKIAFLIRCWTSDKERQILIRFDDNNYVKRFVTFVEQTQVKFYKEPTISQNLTQQWERGMISNFHYLHLLNAFAGRNLVDQKIYSIYPLLVESYEEERIRSTRDLKEPWEAKKDEQKKQKPFGSNKILIDWMLKNIKGKASNSLHTYKFLSKLKFKGEAIPQLYGNPSFLRHLDFSRLTRSSSAEEFVYTMRQELESRRTNTALNFWIDLVFGQRLQKNKEIYHQHCYPDQFTQYSKQIKADSNRADQFLKDIENLGQIPMQLFKSLHPKKEKLTNYFEQVERIKIEKVQVFSNESRIAEAVFHLHYVTEKGLYAFYKSGLVSFYPITEPLQNFMLKRDISGNFQQLNLEQNNLNLAQIQVIEHNKQLFPDYFEMKQHQIEQEDTSKPILVVGGYNDASVRVWNLGKLNQKPLQIFKLAQTSSPVQTVNFNHHKQILVLSSLNVLYLYNFSLRDYISKSPLLTISSHSHPIQVVDLNHQKILSVDAENVSMVHNLEGELLRSFRIKSDWPLTQCIISPTTFLYVFYDKKYNMFAYDLKGSKYLKKLQLHATSQTITFLTPFSSQFLFSNQSSFVVNDIFDLKAASEGLHCVQEEKNYCIELASLEKGKQLSHNHSITAVSIVNWEYTEQLSQIYFAGCDDGTILMAWAVGQETGYWKTQFEASGLTRASF